MHQQSIILTGYSRTLPYVYLRFLWWIILSLFFRCGYISIADLIRLLLPSHFQSNPRFSHPVIPAACLLDLHINWFLSNRRIYLFLFASPYKHRKSIHVNLSCSHCLIPFLTSFHPHLYDIFFNINPSFGNLFYYIVCTT